MSDEIPPPQFDPNKLTNEVYNLLRAKGINRFVFVIGDPDFDVTGRGWSGGEVWAVGACETLKTELMQNFMEKGKEGDSGS